MIKAKISAAVMAHQIPSTPRSMGRMTTEPAWNTSVRRKEMAAETAPLFRAVKKPEAKMLKPASRNDQQNSRKAWVVSFHYGALPME